MLFSHVKILSFRAKALLVFHWCLYNKIISTLAPGNTLWPVYVRWASPLSRADPLYISRRAGPLADKYAVKNMFTIFAKPTRQWLHGNYVHIELSSRLIHTHSLYVFSENASIWKHSWKGIKTKQRIYHISVDGRKRSKNASKWKRWPKYRRWVCL